MARDFLCRTCNYNTFIKCNYIKHLETSKHLNRMTKYSCNLCKMNFKTKQKLHKHLQRLTPCDTLLKNGNSIEVTQFHIKIIYHNLNYIDRTYCFNFEFNSIGIDDILSLYYLSNYLQHFKNQFNGIDLFLKVFESLFIKYFIEKKYLIFNPVNTDILLVKSNIHYNTYEPFNMQLFLYIIRLINFTDYDKNFDIDNITDDNIYMIKINMIRIYKQEKEKFIKSLIQFE